MKQLQSGVIPLPLSNIDTDMILSAEHAAAASSKSLGKYLFARPRNEEPNFPLNQAKYAGCQILCARRNFGYGTTREHAAWALRDWGIRVLIAPSFGDPFVANALNNGILPIVLPSERVEEILEGARAQSSYLVTVDLERQILTLPSGESLPIPLDPYHLDALRKGRVELDELLFHLPKDLRS